MKRLLFSTLLPLAALLLGVAGCDDTYSKDVHYSFRTDPVLMNKPGDEVTVPDPPGQFPIRSAADFLDERNPYFAKNKAADLIKSSVFRDPLMIDPADRQEITSFLDDMFGTPALPIVSGVPSDQRELLKLGEDTLAQGSKLYRVHCLHCHGVTGNGRGPTALWVNPHPRDYRQGRFKFQSVDQTKGAMPPARDDLLRTLEHGIEGTAMPNFGLLPLTDREALVSYVIHLSIRGKTEFDTIRLAYEYDPKDGVLIMVQGKKKLDERMQGFFRKNVQEWVDAQSARIDIGEFPFAGDMANDENKTKFTASVQRGKEMFYEIKGLGSDTCVTCHKDYGRQSTFRFDEWGTYSKPANFTLGNFRGGRRPKDIYNRIHSGIQPSGMIAFGKSLSPEQIWDLVNFVRVLGSPSMRESMKIYVD